MRKVATIEKADTGYIIRLYYWKPFTEPEPVQDGLYIVKSMKDAKQRLKELGISRVLQEFGTVTVNEGLYMARSRAKYKEV